MKKLFISMFMIGFFAIAGNAQEMVASESTAAKPQMSKEERQKLKEKRDAEQIALYKDAGMNDEETKKIMDINADANKKSAEIRKDAALTDEQKKEKLEVIKVEKNNKIKEIMGKDRSKKYNELKKERAEAGKKD